MPLTPTDWPSFALGALLGAVAAFGTGFLKKAGEHAFGYLSNKISPKPPEPIQVDGKFVPIRFAPSECAWVNEAKLYDYEQKGYSYYPHPKKDTRCFRLASSDRSTVKEFLLVQPNSKRVVDV